MYHHVFSIDVDFNTLCLMKICVIDERYHLAAISSFICFSRQSVKIQADFLDEE
jgi:hypothetical protein